LVPVMGQHNPSTKFRCLNWTLNPVVLTYAPSAFTDSHHIFIVTFKLLCQSMSFSALAPVIVSEEEQTPPENYAFHPETELSDVPLSHCLELTCPSNYRIIES